MNRPCLQPDLLNQHFPVFRKHIILSGISLLFFLAHISVRAANYYSIASGPWTSSSTWSLTSGGAAIASGYPGAGDNVVIESGFTVTIAAAGVEDLYAANIFIGGASTSGTLSYPNWNATSTLTVTGDITIGGSGASAAGTLNYATWGLTITCARLLKGNGSASRINPLQQDFTFTGSFTLPIGFNQFRNFIIAGGTVTLSEDITTNGSTSPTINAGSTLDMQTYLMDIGGYGNFNIDGTLIVGGNAGGFGTSNFPNSFTNLTIGASSTVIYSYPGAQSIYPATYNNLTLSGSGLKSVSHLGYVSSLTLTNGGSGYFCDATLNFTGGGGSGASADGYDFGDPGDPIAYLNLNSGGSGYTSAPTISFSGNCGGSGAAATANMTILTAATINGELVMGGAASLSGSVNYGAAATLEYAGTTGQTTGVEFPATWSGTGGVIINNSNGVTLNAARTISSSLTLVNGMVKSSATNLLTISNTSSAAITGGSSISYIDGPLEIALPANLATGSTYLLPVGKSGNYLPLSLVDPRTGAGANTLLVEAFDANSGGSASGAGIISISKTEYWSLVSTGNFTGSSISLARETALGGIDVIGQSNTVNGVYDNLAGTMSGTSVINSNDIGAVASTFFVFGSDFMVLPVTMSALTAFEQQRGVQLKWTVYAETGINSYEIERAGDGQHFNKLGSLPSTGNSDVALDYNWFDANPAYGTNYYRVKAVHDHGEATYSQVVKITVGGASMDIKIYPNPVTGNTVNLDLLNLKKAVYSISIVDQSGRIVLTRSIDHAGGSVALALKLGNHLPAGVYQLCLTGNNIRETRQFMKN